MGAAKLNKPQFFQIKQIIEFFIILYFRRLNNLINLFNLWFLFLWGFAAPS